jgi:hypothetical protein
MLGSAAKFAKLKAKCQNCGAEYDGYNFDRLQGATFKNARFGANRPQELAQADPREREMSALELRFSRVAAERTPAASLALTNEHRSYCICPKCTANKLAIAQLVPIVPSPSPIPVAGYRWTEQDIASFTSAEARQQRSRWALIVVAVLFLLAVLAAPLQYMTWLVIAVFGAVIAPSIANLSLRQQASLYENLARRWGECVRASDPQALVPASIPLKDTERLIYEAPSTKLAMLEISGHAQLVGVDNGQLIVTNERFIFLGNKQTIEQQAAQILRTALSGSTVIFEYPGRLTGEAYQIDPLLFWLCAYRRKGFGQWDVPTPPPPLPLTLGPQIQSDAR